MKYLFLSLILPFVISGCEVTTLTFTESVNCNNDYDELDFRLKHFDTGEEAEVYYENGELTFSKIQPGDYSLLVEGRIEGLGYKALSMQRKVYLPNTWGNSSSNIPPRPPSGPLVYNENEPEVRLTIPWNVDDCLPPSGYRVYSSTEYPFPLNDETRVDGAWFDNFESQVVIPLPDSNAIFIVEAVSWGDISFKSRSDTFSLKPVIAEANNVMEEGGLSEFVTGQGDYIDIWADLVADSLYRLDIYDSDNSTFSAFHVVVFSDAWTGGRRGHKPNGRPVLFRAPVDGLMKFRVHKAAEGLAGSFGLKITRFNAFDFSTTYTFDMNDPADIHVVRADLKAGNRVIRTRAKTEDKPPIYLSISSLWPREDFYTEYQIAHGLPAEASELGFKLSSNRNVYFFYTTTYYHDSNKVFLGLY